MLIKALKAKIHNATITEAKLHYTGSIAIDSDLMAQVGIVPYEAVLVADLDNGNRLETYVVPAQANSGEISILGAAAQLIKPNDKIIILNFSLFTPDELKEHKPNIIVLDDENKIMKKL